MYEHTSTSEARCHHQNYSTNCLHSLLHGNQFNSMLITSKSYKCITSGAGSARPICVEWMSCSAWWKVIDFLDRDTSEPIRLHHCDVPEPLALVSELPLGHPPFAPPTQREKGQITQLEEKGNLLDDGELLWQLFILFGDIPLFTRVQQEWETKPCHWRSLS